MKLNLMRFAFSACLLFSSCGEVFLEVKPTKSQRIPAELADYLALMDNISMMNTRSSHSLGIIGADEFMVPEARYEAFPTAVNRIWQAKAYVWSDDVFQGKEGTTSDPLDWNMGYQRILWCNLVLDGLAKLDVDEANKREWENTKGIALFHRAFNYYSLAQLFCPAYREETIKSEFGLPLRLEADVTGMTLRSTVGDTYKQIIRDLMEAEMLLPDQSITVFRPSKNAVYALLARVYLQMGDYQNALEFTDRCIRISAALMDFNTLNPLASRSFPPNGQGNPEVIFMNSVFQQWILRDAYFSADPQLLSSYDSTDLRKSLYFTSNASTGNVLFKGSYEGTANFFTGLATDEVYLIGAEASARQQDVSRALNYLNDLRKHRYDQTDFSLLQSNDQNEVLGWVLQERRKELILRGTRWEDLRRLNQDPEHAKTLIRELGELMIQLTPGDVKYVWPIPLEVIQYGGYKQNPR